MASFIFRHDLIHSGFPRYLYCMYQLQYNIRSPQDRKICPEDHCLASRGLSSDGKSLIPRERFFYPILTRLMYSFSCSPLLNTIFHVIKRPPEILEYAEMGHDIMASL